MANYSFRELVMSNDPDYNKRNDVTYEFSGGRKFRSTDHTDNGVYGGVDYVKFGEDQVTFGDDNVVF